MLQIMTTLMKEGCNQKFLSLMVVQYSHPEPVESAVALRHTPGRVLMSASAAEELPMKAKTSIKPDSMVGGSAPPNGQPNLATAVSKSQCICQAYTHHFSSLF